MRTEERVINLRQIDLTHSLYRMSFHSDISVLKESVAAAGIINPPLVKEADDKKYIIICGLKRINAAYELNYETVNVRCIRETSSEIELFNTAFYDNLTVRSFNLTEKANIINTLSAYFKISDTDLLNKYLKCFEAANIKWKKWSKIIVSMPSCIQESMQECDISFDVIDFFEGSEISSVKAVMEVISACGMGKNKQKEFILLVRDLLRIRNMNIQDFFSKENYDPVIHDSLLTPSQKSDKIFTMLKTMRYPEYTKAQEDFKQWIKTLHLPSLSKIEHSPYFESEWYNLNLHFKNRAETEKFAEKFLKS